MKTKLGFVLGLLAFLLIYFATPNQDMWFSAYNIVLKHADSEVVAALGTPLQETNSGAFDRHLERARTIFVKIPADFDRSGTNGITLDMTGANQISLYDAIEQQVVGLKRTLALAVLMAVFWICEVLPLPVVAMFPMVLLPLLGIASYNKSVLPGYFLAFSPYMHYLIVLFIGGFTIATAMQRWGLHERIAFGIMRVIGFSPRRILLAFMVATAAISMFVSNTATAAMMMPIGLALISSGTKSPTRENFGKALMLGIAYAASIGGIGTLIGSPPNLVLAGFADILLGKTITFTDWLMIGLPLVIILIPITWFFLLKMNSVTGVRSMGSKELVKERSKALGKLRGGELNTLIIFGLVAVLWITRALWTEALNIPWVGDASIAIFGLILFYIVPVDLKNWEFTLDWKTNLQIPWGILLLFGGGLALGQALISTGAAEFLAMKLTALHGVHTFLLLIFIILLVELITEVTSNTASANMMMPILYFLGIAIGTDPLLLMTGGAVAASLAFMLPVATPPNAIVFGSGYVKMKDMIKNGFFLELIAASIWALLLYFGARHLWTSFF